MDLRDQQQDAAERYRRTAAQRREIRRRQKATGSPIVDSPEQIAARAERLLSHGELGVATLARAMIVGSVGGAPADPGEVLERIVGAASELQSVNFLDRGRRAARTVGKVTIREGRRVAGFGTGFLVGRRLLLTNNHVLPDATTAGTSFVEFDDELDVDGLQKPTVRFDLDPGPLFLTDEHLDMTLVAVAPGPGGRPPGDLFGHNELVANQGKIVVGEPVNVVGHPEGRPKELAIRNNALLNQLPEFLQYEADTLPGDSGAAAFNDQWEVVALHHAGVPETVDGQLRWVANEGVRISVVLAHLAELDLPPAQRTVLAELGEQARAGAVPVPEPVPRPDPPVRVTVRPLEATTSGLIGRPLAGRQLVFLHGRGLLGTAPAAARADWAGGLARGLAAAGLPPVDATAVWFPYYADDLEDAVAAPERASTPVDGRTTVAEAMAPADPAARATYGALLQEAAVRAGMPAAETVAPEEAGLFGGLISVLQRPLSWLAARSGLDEVVIAAVFRDVAAYLDRGPVREAVLGAVLADLPAGGEIVLVAHSLGTVVALDVLTRLPAGVRVPLLVTTGSPLGLDAVYGRLLAGGPVRPGVVGTWVNAWAAADAVAIGCPLGDTWPGVRDIRTDNQKDRAHDIREYLSDGRVAAAIGALVG